MSTWGGRALASLALALAVLGVVPGPAAAGPRVHVIATGGTISNDPGGRLAPEQLLATVPGRERLGEVLTESFANVSSTTLALDDWLRLSHRVGDVLRRDGTLDGLVVTTGTDTLEELAWFLHLTVTDARPVVVVGAMRRPAHPRADGPRNFGDAIRVAGSREATDRGVLVVMNGQVHAAAHARKRRTSGPDAFDAPPDSVEGLVTPNRVRFLRPPARASRRSFALGDRTRLPRVDILLTYQGASADPIEGAVRSGARGLVLAGAGAGALTRSQRDAAVRVALHGVPVVVSSRTGEGQVTAEDPVDERLIPAGPLDPFKARILLMLALATGMGDDELRALFGNAARDTDAVTGQGSRRPWSSRSHAHSIAEPDSHQSAEHLRQGR